MHRADSTWKSPHIKFTIMNLIGYVMKCHFGSLKRRLKQSELISSQVNIARLQLN